MQPGLQPRARVGLPRGRFYRVQAARPDQRGRLPRPAAPRAAEGEGEEEEEAPAPKKKEKKGKAAYADIDVAALLAGDEEEAPQKPAAGALRRWAGGSSWGLLGVQGGCCEAGVLAHTAGRAQSRAHCSVQRPCCCP